MKGLNFGVIGIGQGGVNIADVFAKTFPAIAINTAPQDLQGLSNIKTDLRIHTEITAGGGAGKDIRLGEKAIRKHEEKVTNATRLNFAETDYIWLTVGLGGGSGTLGVVQLSRILSILNKKHGIICTIPARDEGTNEVVNAMTGIYMIEQARKQFNQLRSIIMIDNEKLKNYVLDNYNVSYENFWNKANEYIYNSFFDLYEYSQKSSITSFDTTDYIKLFDKRGYMLFGKGKIEEIENKSETALVSEVKNLWKDGIFTNGLDVKKAKGIAIVVNRPSSYDKDGKVINRLFSEIKKDFGAGSFCRGVYSNGNKITEFVKSKPVEVFTLLAGMPIPIEQINRIKNIAESEHQRYQEKELEIELEFDKNIVLDILEEKPQENNPTNKDLYFFDEPLNNVKEIKWKGFEDVK
ncbi:MAG: hypothetical protein ACOCRK_06520 [bacterium]